MTDTKNIIIQLKQIRDEKNLSFGDIMSLLENNGDYLSKTTLSRIFAEGSEEGSFRYEETLKPLCNALLDIENIEETDSMDVQAMKTLLKYKSDRIEDLEQQIEHQRSQFNAELVALHEKMDAERESWSRSIEFLKEQINFKDKRMDLLLQAVQDKDSRYDEILKLVLACPWRTKPTDCGDKE